MGDLKECINVECKSASAVLQERKLVDGSNKPKFYVKCSKCGVEGNGYFHTPAEATANWNSAERS